MKRFILLAAVSALVIARPETYKEQEDFQYSRSSSDDGTKSGYYGAQRGNMGGNYERAHNMDGLAQHQMSGLVRQVNGELGDGIKTRSGSVYSAANSRGTYGSGSYDLSNLAGRNFQEGTFSDNSQLSSAQYSSSAHNSAGYASSTSQNYGSNRKIVNDAQIQTENLQSLDNMHSSNQNSYGRRSSGYSSQAGFQEHSQYNSDSANSNSGYGSTQYTKSTPVRIIVKPGGRVAIPIGAQIYDANQGSAVSNHNALSNDDELTGEVNQGSVNRPSNAKYYETSYRYHKKWEKHATIPPPIVVYPTESPIPKNSELNDDLDVHRSNYQNNARGADYQNAHLSSASERYNAAQASSQSRYQSNYNSQQSTGDSNSNAFTRSGYSSNLNRGVSSDSSNAYTQAQHNSGSRYYGVAADSNLNTQTRHKADAQLDLNDQVESLNNRPKSYQSSYSYHKSWERQGDPYVIKPASSGYYDSQTSQRLASSTKNLGYTTYQPSSNCDEKCHIRVARSYGTDNQDLEQQQSRSTVEDQHVRSTWTNLEELGQQSQKTNEQQAQNQWDNLKDLSQQSQNTWDQQNVGQQSQINWDNSKDLTQQSQNNWDQQNVGQQSQTNWDNLKDLTQQSQTNWDQQSVGQQTQTQWDHLEDLGQQSQSNWDQQNVGQQTQTQWDRLEDLGHQSKQDVPQQTEDQGSNSQDLSQQSQINWDQQNEGQQSQNHWDNLEDLGQQSQRNWDQSNVGQQSNSNWDKIEKLNQSSLKNWGTLDVGQHSLDQNKWDQQDSEILGQRAQNNQDNKPQDDLYAQYDHKLEVIRPNIQLEHPQSSNEKENNKKVNNINANKSETAFAQQNTDLKTGFERFSNKNSMDQKITDDALLRQVLQSHKMNFNNKDNVWPSQKDSNDNTDYSYSSGFVNPFFYHKTQLANNENIYAANSPEFESIWNSHMHTNSHSQANWHIINKSQSNTDVQQTSLSNLWSKIDTGLGFSFMNHTDFFPKTNETNSNFTLLANRDMVSEIQPWYAIDTTNILKANTEINTAVTKQENHKDEAHSKFTHSTQTYRESKDTPKNINATLNSDKPETSEDIGRGDIGPDDSIDINETNNPYNNPISTILISQNTVNDPTKHDNAKPIANNTYTRIKQELPEDHLTVLGLEQQKNDTNNDTNIVVTYNNDTTHNILQNDKNEIKQLQNLNENKVESQSHSDHQTKYFGIQTDISTQSYTNSKNYSQHNVESQNNVNFDQESINIEQENAYNFGQDSSQETLRNNNVEQQNLHNFGQEQVPDAGQKSSNIERHTDGHENMLHLGRQNKNISLLNEILFRQESVQEIKKKNENSLQQYFKPEHNDNVIKTNLSRVQKSVQVSNLDKNEDHLFQNFGQQIQSEINYGADYEPQMNSYEQEFDQDFYMQYQSHSKNFSQESEKQQNKHDIAQETHTSQTDKQDHLVSTVPMSTVETGHSIYAQIFRPPVTPKPSFWKTVGNKFTSAKNQIASWFKS